MEPLRRWIVILKAARVLAHEFNPFELTNIQRSNNSSVDALAVLASTSDPSLKRMILVESINFLSIEVFATISVIRNPTEVETTARAEEDKSKPIEAEFPQNDWRDELRLYITDGYVPADKWQA